MSEVSSKASLVLTTNSNKVEVEPMTETEDGKSWTLTPEHKRELRVVASGAFW